MRLTERQWRIIYRKRMLRHLKRILLIIAVVATVAVLALAWVTTVEAQAAYATVMGR